MDAIREDLEKAINTSLINYREDSIEDYRPKLIVNNYKKGSKVINYLIKELSSCEEFCFSVAFITNSGLNLLLNVFNELEKRKIHGKVLTTNYLYFNDPSALRRLLKFKNLEVKIYDDGNFHSKGYIFKNRKNYNFIIGSSNLTQEALTLNEEWNIKITSLADGELLRDTLDEFSSAWARANILTDEWINNYEKEYQKSKMITPAAMKQLVEPAVFGPNKMQVEAMENLKVLRENGADKALLISATGTGKTFLSAFDVKQFNPKKMLFIIHREQIAQAAKDSFEKIFGKTKTMGLFSGNKKELDCDFIFSTIQTLSKDSSLEQFSPDYFDYIIVDEVHHIGAETYQKVFNYFKPKFLLGMTATPERSDGYDIYKLFNYNIAYEIRLQHALENDMLCPFHYFGVSEITDENGELLNDNSSFNLLVSDERVKHIIEKTSFYGHSGERVKGLIFCSRNEEAKILSDRFNELGYNTVALSGSNSQSEREEAVQKLSQDSRFGGLDYIFTVDIFNEGIDIPKINQIVMLRPTESAIIFVQQLGRGLRKNPEKDFVVVIDFIGNYQKNFMIPVALSGSKKYRKDELRRMIFDGTALIPGCSSIMFEQIVKERIYDSINKTNFSQLKFLRDNYVELKNKIGRIPTVYDFYKYGAVDPQLIFSYSESLQDFIMRIDPENYKVRFNKTQLDYIRFISKYISNCKRPHEIIAILQLLEKEKTTNKEIHDILSNVYNIHDNMAGITSAFSILCGGYYIKSVWAKYHNNTIATMDGNVIRKTDTFAKCLDDKTISAIKDILKYAIRNWKDNYQERYNDTNLCLYQQYSRLDILRLLNWAKDETMTIFGDPGYQRAMRTNTYPIIINYDKKEDISETTKYEDHFIDRDTFSWYTQNKVQMSSDEIKLLQNLEKNNVTVQLFIRKSVDVTDGYYYLGNMKPTNFVEKQMKNGDKTVPVVNIDFKMDTPVREDIYNYITE